MLEWLLCELASQEHRDKVTIVTYSQMLTEPEAVADVISAEIGGSGYRFNVNLARQKISKSHDLGDLTIEDRRMIDRYLAGGSMGSLSPGQDRDLILNDIALLREQLPNELISRFLVGRFC